MPYYGSVRVQWKVGRGDTDPRKGLRSREGAVVGDRERIEVDLAHALVNRLEAAGFELHQALSLDGAAELHQHVTSALAEIDVAIRLIRRAAADFETPGDTAPTS